MPSLLSRAEPESSGVSTNVAAGLDYVLGVGDGTLGVRPETEVEIASGASVPFRVHNRMSFVDVACGEHVAWTGSQM